MIETLLVCDGHNLVYRSFFAIRNLSTADGRPTNAVYGFIRLIESLRVKYKPSHLVVVFDGGIPARRMKLLESYKAQRPHMPDDLRLQMGAVKRYLSAAGILNIEIDNEEADDVIATIAEAAGRLKVDNVLLATSDKDLLQLATEHVRICPPAGKADPLGPNEVREKIGVKPEQVVDWLALIGDTADNIPGINGVGPKTAAKLINKFGSLETLMARLDDVEPEKLREKLRAGRQLIERNVGLVELDRAVPLGVSIADMKVAPPDERALLRFFEEMEFAKMASNLREPSLF